MSTHPEYRPHPRAVPFPPLSEQVHKELRASIAAVGQQEPIEVQAGTRYVLDGLHRLQACRELERDPLVREVEVADDAVPTYTAAKAARRPGLTATQKVLLALLLLPSLRVGRGKAAGRAADAVGVSRAYVERGIELRDNAPELLALVEAGEFGLSEAYRRHTGAEPREQGRGGDEEADAFVVPNRLRERLAAAARAAHEAGRTEGDYLGYGVEALLDFVEGGGRGAWERWLGEAA